MRLQKITPLKGLYLLWGFFLLLLLPIFGVLIWRAWPAGALFSDYQAMYAAIHVALDHGFAKVYDLQFFGDFQASAFNQFVKASRPFPGVLPAPYLPAFILLLLPLYFFDFPSGYIFWFFFNLFILGIYLFRFIRTSGNKKGLEIYLLLVVCIPVLQNLLLGQLNIWLLVCMGEFLLSCQAEKEFGGGLWLGGLLLKPQILILLLPGLLLGKRYRILGGFALSSLGIMGLSLTLIGNSGLRELVVFVLEYSSNASIVSPAAMVNWRAVGTNLSGLLPGAWVWPAAWLGGILTAGIVLALWLQPVDPTSIRFGLLLLATSAGTSLVTWHSHLHMLLPLIPLFLFLIFPADAFPGDLIPVDF